MDISLLLVHDDPSVMRGVRMRLEVEGGEARVARAWREYLPDVTTGVFYGDVAGYPAIPVRGTNGEDQLGVTFGINLAADLIVRGPRRR